jgi:DNA-binding NtrC family response regulator
MRQMQQEDRGKVLIVDIDERVLIALEQLLEDAGIGTATTWSAKQALELLRSEDFDAVLAGDHLAELTCEQLMREAQQRGLGASILVMAGKKTSSSAAYFGSLGAAATVRKREFGTVLETTKMLLANRLRKRARAA